MFVNDVLGLTKEDTEGINEVLADLASLDIMVDEFLSNFNVPFKKSCKPSVLFKKELF